MSVISAIRDFIAAECPYLDEFSEVFSGVSKVEVDTLDENPKNYMIEVAPADPVVRTYTGPQGGVPLLQQGVLRGSRQY